jgi:hypothetical protein
MCANGSRGIPAGPSISRRLRRPRRNAVDGFCAKLMYTKGRGASQDFVIAHMGFNLAAAQGNQGAGKNRGLIEGGMTSARIAEAQIAGDVTGIAGVMAGRPLVGVAILRARYFPRSGGQHPIAGDAGLAQGCAVIRLQPVRPRACGIADCRGDPECAILIPSGRENKLEIDQSRRPAWIKRHYRLALRWVSAAR